MTVKSKLAGALANVALVLLSCLAILLVAEVVLRFIHPKYEHLAEATAVRDQGRFMPEPGHRRGRRHPDTGEWHAILVNSLGLRQHRDFTAADLESAVNIGFFGDSFTDNVNMAAEFSFTEPLDYLLNVERAPAPQEGAQGQPQPSFNVLNFGHGGWEPRNPCCGTKGLACGDGWPTCTTSISETMWWRTSPGGSRRARVIDRLGGFASTLPGSWSGWRLGVAAASP